MTNFEIHSCGSGWAYCDGNCADCKQTSITYPVRRPLYLCNPDLAKEKCSQTGCYLNGGPCELTTNPEYAVHVVITFPKDGPIDIPLCVMSLKDINDGIKNGTLNDDIDRRIAVAKTIVKERN